MRLFRLYPSTLLHIQFLVAIDGTFHFIILYFLCIIICLCTIWKRAYVCVSAPTFFIVTWICVIWENYWKIRSPTLSFIDHHCIIIIIVIVISIMRLFNFIFKQWEWRVQFPPFLSIFLPFFALPFDLSPIHPDFIPFVSAFSFCFSNIPLRSSLHFNVTWVFYVLDCCTLSCICYTTLEH